jgi:hypothetical protein
MQGIGSHFSAQNPAPKGYQMKLAIRLIALTVVFAGVAAASVSSNSKIIASHQSATATNPVPLCAPGLPTCPPVTSGR